MTIPELLPEAEAAAFASNLLQKIGEVTPDLIYAKDLQSRMIFANPAVLAALGKAWAEIRGRADDEWADDPAQARAFMKVDARVMRLGITEEAEETLTQGGETHIFLSSKSPLRAPDGSIIGMFGISKDITARKNEERLRETLVNELDHRVRNTLGLVQAMARQTFRHAGIDRALWDAFEARLVSMSKAHGLLTQQSWAGADIADVVAEALGPHGGQDAARFTMTGPSAWVAAQTALSLALAFHELATNATKYGALSVPEGRVAISWDVDPGDDGAMLDIHWRETDGPPVVEPSRKGFGSKLIEQALAQSLVGTARISYLPAGLQFHVRCRVAERLAL